MSMATHLWKSITFISVHARTATQVDVDDLRVTLHQDSSHKAGSGGKGGGGVGEGGGGRWWVG